MVDKVKKKDRERKNKECQGLSPAQLEVLREKDKMNQRLCRNMSRGIHEIIIIDLLAAK